MFFWTKKFAVLSGGGARGIAHLAFLEKYGNSLKGIVGTSAGALGAALYSFFDGDIEKVKEIAFQLFEMQILSDIEEHFQKESNLFSSAKRFFTEVKLIKENALFSAGEVKERLTLIFGSTKVKDLPLPVYPTGIDIKTGTYTVFRNTTIVDALMASMAIPLVFPPYLINGMHFLDGGFLDNSPLLIARLLGAGKICYSDISGRYKDSGEELKGSEILHKLLIINTQYISSLESGIADITYKFPLKGYSWSQFSKGREIYELAKETISTQSPRKSHSRLSGRVIRKFSGVKWNIL